MYAIKDSHKLLKRIYYSIDLHVCAARCSKTHSKWSHAFGGWFFHDAHGEWMNDSMNSKKIVLSKTLRDHFDVVNIFQVSSAHSRSHSVRVSPISQETSHVFNQMPRVDSVSQIEYIYGVTVSIAGSHERLIECVATCVGWRRRLPSDDTKFQSKRWKPFEWKAEVSEFRLRWPLKLDYFFFTFIAKLNAFPKKVKRPHQRWSNLSVRK